MRQIIAITNQKGGVGKTTTAYNLASSLSKYNKKILLIDLDPQGNCSQAIGFDPTLSKRTIAELFTGESELHKVIKKTSIKNIHLIPANLHLAMVESFLIQQNSRFDPRILKEKLNCKEVNLYDYVIIDCPPSLGLLSLSGLIAANSLIIPVQCEFFALDALAQLLSTIHTVQQSYNPSLEIMGILLTMFDSRTKFSTEIASEVRQSFKDKVFTTYIPRNVNISEAINVGMPINDYKPKSAGSLAYASLAREVLEFNESKENK